MTTEWRFHKTAPAPFRAVEHAGRLQCLRRRVVGPCRSKRRSHAFTRASTARYESHPPRYKHSVMSAVAIQRRHRGLLDDPQRDYSPENKAIDSVLARKKIITVIIIMTSPTSALEAATLPAAPASSFLITHILFYHLINGGTRDKNTARHAGYWVLSGSWPLERERERERRY